jgi:5-hydroxyisourate hydrolase
MGMEKYQMGRLTTHVLDTHLGRPAEGLILELWSLTPEPKKLKTTVTNADGRVDEPLLQGEYLKPGTYELRFSAGDYLSHENTAAVKPPFLDVIPIRFGISDTTQHYHVPLLLSAHGYSTYRGS